MAATARVHRLYIELSGSKIKLHGLCVREIDDGANKVNVGNCDVEVEVSAAEVKPLLDKVKAELTRRTALPDEYKDAKQFADLPIS